MELSRAHPELRSRLRWIPPIPYHIPLVRVLAGALSKLWRGFKGDEKIKVRWIDHGESQSKIYQPVAPATNGAVFFIHGGGYVLGHADIEDALCLRIVEALGITVVSVDYRLAPAHPFPAPLNDCMASWQWLQGHASELGVDPRRVVVSGQSAGGGLAAALTQRIHDEGGQQPAAQLLLCPMLDDRTALREELTRERHFVWNNDNNRGGWHGYLGQEPGSPEVPPYSVPARRESLAGLPATWLSVGTIDLFLEETIAYAKRLESGGVESELFLGEGGSHAFESYFPNSSISVAHWESMFAFVRRVLAES
jgi:acetyl esterase/lipase